MEVLVRQLDIAFFAKAISMGTQGNFTCGVCDCSVSSAIPRAESHKKHRQSSSVQDVRKADLPVCRMFERPVHPLLLNFITLTFRALDRTHNVSTPL